MPKNNQPSQAITACEDASIALRERLEADQLSNNLASEQLEENLRRLESELQFWGAASHPCLSKVDDRDRLLLSKLHSESIKKLTMHLAVVQSHKAMQQARSGDADACLNYWRMHREHSDLEVERVKLMKQCMGAYKDYLFKAFSEAKTYGKVGDKNVCIFSVRRLRPQGKVRLRFSSFFDVAKPLEVLCGIPSTWDKGAKLELQLHDVTAGEPGARLGSIDIASPDLQKRLTIQKRLGHLTLQSLSLLRVQLVAHTGEEPAPVLAAGEAFYYGK